MGVSPASFRTAGPFPFGGGPRRGLFRRWRPATQERETRYLAVRSLAAAGGEHLLQYALVDDGGDVIFDAVTRTPSPVGLASPTAAVDAPVSSMEPHAFDARLACACEGARLVAFHAVLQGGLLPPASLAGGAEVACAWRRFRKVARSRGLRLGPGEPQDLADALARAGLTPPAGEGAADRATALRTLWRWMEAKE